MDLLKNMSALLYE